jgi:DNA-binding SARP family transcriptional activator
MEQPITIKLLGGLRLCDGDLPLAELPPQRPGRLLAYLALNRQRAVPREEATAALWPDADAGTGRQNFRQALYLLRSEFRERSVAGPDRILATRDTIRLNPEAVRVDTVEFLEALRAAQSAQDPERRLCSLEEAIERYTGELLPGFYDEVFVQERIRLANLHRSALNALVRVYRDNGRLDRAIELARLAVTLDPLDEEGHCELIRVYASCGNTAVARRHYLEFEKVLKRELGMGPSDATRRLVESLAPSSSDGASGLAATPGRRALHRPPPALAAHMLHSPLPREDREPAPDPLKTGSIRKAWMGLVTALIPWR